MRINKYLTDANFCSRREADRLIERGRVRINTKEAKLGDQVAKTDQVYVDGELIKPESKKVYLAYNKPVGVITTTDKNSPDNIIDAINYPTRVYPIGRLDVETSGLILLTNDGGIVNKILKGQNKVEKEYEVEVDKRVSKEVLKKLEKGVVLDGYKTLPAMTKKLAEKKFSITIVEGKNRQIRRMAEVVGYNVMALKRVRVGGLKLGDLKQNEFIELTQKDVKTKVIDKRP